MIDNEILNEYFNARRDDNFNNVSVMTYRFKLAHPSEFKLISAFQRKRTQLRKDAQIMSYYSNKLYWFTLTFDEDKDKNLETTKRKECFKFLNSLFALFNLVEEHGEEKGRYHLHGLGVFREGKTYKDFYEWHSRESIYLLKDGELQAKIKYLTNYMSKSVPRIRRNKRLSWLRKKTDKTLDPVFLKNSPTVAKNIINQHLFAIDMMCLRDV